MNKLRELREKQNYSLSELSKRIKTKTQTFLSPQTLMRFEKNSADIHLSKLVSIADYFDVSIDYLVGRTGDE